MTITIKSNPDGVSGAIQVNGVDRVTIGASGITAGSFAPNSIDAAAAALAFSGANQSLNTSGYQKLPSGLIIQWGSGSITAQNQSVSFPIAFPTTCASVVMNDGASAGNSVGTLAYGTVSASAFTVYSAQGTTATTWGTFNWVALGY